MKDINHLIEEIKLCNVFEGKIIIGETYTFKEGGYIAHCILNDIRWNEEGKFYEVELDIFKDSHDSQFKKPFILSFSPEIKDYYYSGRISIMQGITYSLEKITSNYK